MPTKTTPYEVLVRFDEAGKLKGAHAQFLDTITDDAGAVLAQKVGHAMPIAVAGRAGFPLKDILDAVHIAALEAVDDANAEKDKKEAARAELEADHAEKLALAEKIAGIAEAEEWDEAQFAVAKAELLASKQPKPERRRAELLAKKAWIQAEIDALPPKAGEGSGKAKK